MSGTKEIKRRIKSIRNTKKITKAMELVAASKMRRAVSRAVNSRAYATCAREILETVSKLGSRNETVTHPLLERGSGERVLFIVIAANRGLCGVYNSAVYKKLLETSKDLDASLIDCITIGKKSEIAVNRLKLTNVASFNDLPDAVGVVDILPITKIIFDSFKSGKYSTVKIIFTDYVSALSQVAKIRQLLPLKLRDLEKLVESLGGHQSKDFAHKELNLPDVLLEPEATQLLEFLIERLLRMQIYQMLLESKASEESSRMIAMKNASEAAGEMIDGLTLVFNKARQSSITQEISEISAGMAALN